VTFAGFKPVSRTRRNSLLEVVRKIRRLQKARLRFRVHCTLKFKVCLPRTCFLPLNDMHRNSRFTCQSAKSLTAEKEAAIPFVSFVLVTPYVDMIRVSATLALTADLQLERVSSESWLPPTAASKHGPRANHYSLFVISIPACMQTDEWKTKLRGFGPRANYTDRATAACWRS
jgi:hypothetical protein